MPRSLVIAITVIGAGLYAAVVWWTFRRLWQPASNPYRRIVYKFGVRGAGLSFWILMSVTGALSAASPSVPPWASTLIALYSGLPLALRGGYFWGRMMAWVYGLSDSP